MKSHSEDPDKALNEFQAKQLDLLLENVKFETRRNTASFVPQVPVDPPQQSWGITQGKADIENGAFRTNQNKLRFSLMPVKALESINAVFEYGAKKYTEDNWRKGFHHKTIYDSLMRHLFAWIKGEDFDAESGLPHLAHAGCNILMLLEHYVSNLGIDNRG